MGKNATEQMLEPGAERGDALLVKAIAWKCGVYF